MKDVFGKIIELILAVIAEILNFLDDAIPIFALFLYRLFVLILLYSITQQLNEIIRILRCG